MRETLLAVYGSVAGVVTVVGQVTATNDDEKWKRLPAEGRTRVRMVRLVVGLFWPVVVSGLVGWGIYRVARSIGRWVAWEMGNLLPVFVVAEPPPPPPPSPSPDLGPHRTPRPPECPKCGRPL